MFSKRYGYSSINEVVLREQMTHEIENAICNCFDDFRYRVNNYPNYSTTDILFLMEGYLWRYFLNKRMSSFTSYTNVFSAFILECNNKWYRKLDIIEYALAYLDSLTDQNSFLKSEIDILTKSLNYEFNRLNYAYRIIDNQFIEVTSEEEITSIQKAIDDCKDTVREHLKKAIELCSKRPVGDYRNSIKESISAVEVICRKKTGEDTLGKALKHLEKNGIAIPNMLKSAFEKLYAYTNNEETGIRHALMDDDGSYTPGSDEALFMLVSCSAFINYLNKK